MSVQKKNFLRKIRQLANQKNIILIFDECTSGFREAFGGIHKKYGVEPDMAMYGKTLGNGYAITAVVGRRSVMEYAQKTFISSTFWTERIGPSAALKSLEVMEKEKSWERITETGKQIQKNWKRISEIYNVGITIQGIPSLSSFSFTDKKNLELKTLLTQEFLERGYLGSTIFYPSISHNDDIMNKYFEVFEVIMSKISKCINENMDIKKILKYPVCHSGFKRLN